MAAALNAIVVREHGDLDSAVLADETGVREWLRQELFLVEDGHIAAGDPTPSLNDLHRIAHRNGWTITINPVEL